MKEEISISELLDEFNLKLDLPKRILEYSISSDFLKADLDKSKSEYVFKVDSVVMTIKPKDKNNTIEYFVIIDGDIKGGFILGYDSMEYLN